MTGVPEHFGELSIPAAFSDYYRGKSSGDMELPQNVVMFPRKNTSELRGPAATHYRFVLILSYSGEVAVVVDNAILTVGPGDALLVFPYQFHHYIVQPGSEIAWLFITFELTNLASDRIAHMKSAPVRFVESAGHVQALVNEFAKPDSEGNRANRRVVLLTGLILDELSSKAPRRPSAPGDAPVAMAFGALPGLINSYIYANLDRNLKIRDIARRFNLSQSRIRTLYRNAMGMGLGSYIRRIKVRRGMELMRSTDMKLARVAGECGYGSLVAFTYAFKREAGIAPGAFRRHMMGP
jgi:AraC-like DNA-binding protein